MKALMAILLLSSAVVMPATADYSKELLQKEAEKNCRAWAKEDDIEDADELEKYVADCIAQYSEEFDNAYNNNEAPAENE